MVGQFNIDGSIYQRLARDKGVLAACVDKAKKLAARAKEIDPAGDFVITTDIYKVNGLDRVVAVVTNKAPEAAKREFGGAKQAAYRPLGRASAQLKE